MDATTDRLVQYTLSVGASEISGAVAHECKRRLIDTLACAVAAYDVPLCQKARALAARSTGTPPAHVWGCSSETTVDLAAFANGVMLRYLDLSDQYRVKTGGHPSDVIAPLLAVADAHAVSGKAVITAMALAYEVYCSFCETVAVKAKGWDQPVFAVIASVVGVAKLLNLDRDQMAHAIALAIAPNMALAQTRRGELSSWKGCAGANASRNAVFAAYLAQDGFTGPSAIFEGRSGLWEILGTHHWDVAAPGTAPGRILLTNVKCFPVCFHGQSAVWAALELRKRADGRSIRSIEVETYDVAVEEMAKDPTRWAPKTHETADHSLPYVIAAALTDGEVTQQSFTSERLRDPALADLMSKTKVRADPQFSAQYPESDACRMKIELATGELLSTELRHPKGHAGNPMSDHDFEMKFHTLARDHIDEKRRQALLSALWAFDQADDMREVLKLLVPLSAH